MSNFTFAHGAQEQEVAVYKLVTGELVIGKLNKEENIIENVALIMPREVQENGENKFGFYVVPYGFPMTQKIVDESLCMTHVIKVFSPVGGFEDVLEMYTKIITKEKEQNNG